MLFFFKYFLIYFLISQLFSQRTYRSTDEIKSEWIGYTSYQKDEMISYCDFLFKEKHYERCLITSFQLLLKLGDDPIVPVVNYYIGRCYEQLKSFDLAIKFYNIVLNSTEGHTDSYKAAYYRFMHVNLLMGKNDQLLIDTRDTRDPYLLILQGYAFLNNREFGNARASFISAQSIFNHPHYNKLITPLYKVIEDVGSVKSHNKFSILLSGLAFPGGGHYMLQDYDEAKGISLTVGLLMLINYWGKVEGKSGKNRFYYNEPNSFPIFNSYDNIGFKNILDENDKMPIKLEFKFSDNSRMPSLLGIGVLLSSSWFAYKKTISKNLSLITYYVNDQINKFPASDFFDFPEPQLYIQSDN